MFPTVLTCCCCINLKTGGYILGVLQIFFSIKIMIQEVELIQTTIGIYLGIFWIYGIAKGKSIFMLPGVIVSFFTMIIFFLSPILMPMLKKFHLSRYIPHIYHELKQLPESSFILVYIILVVYSIYMWIVKYSIYRFIKNPNAEQDILPTYEKDTVICPAEKPQQTESDDKNCWLTMNDVVATNPTVFFPTNL